MYWLQHCNLWRFGSLYNSSTLGCVLVHWITSKAWNVSQIIYTRSTSVLNTSAAFCRLSLICEPGLPHIMQPALPEIALCSWVNRESTACSRPEDFPCKGMLWLGISVQEFEHSNNSLCTCPSRSLLKDCWRWFSCCATWHRRLLPLDLYNMYSFV